ncbi:MULTISPECIES: hypothetical protein [Stenotrophomonas]|uniref:Uncharacterized protein n=1 Tax=Stenotrophomonas maltophilia TaxID=40324 RepID=A0A2J0SP16_STEMA|nr:MULTISPECIES: hypothetical protein [Stenotrophomonas]MBA0310873.1 hypothetical protein [Stenotrophomonas maltophilia]MBH1748203.1 hypothetical protein [Stenotrophomonas maltophilia]MBH1866478.1 hypothetical protein [Stenotrophomonas maltophilia]MDH1388221.1 hypothetical protein [Stenotrophomonas sp. GD03701]MDH1393957.1 hypothetical protein [Stenotrophomonas sp. GD03702]
MPLSVLHASQALPMLFDATDGSIRLGNLPTLIGPTLSLDEARIAFATLMHGERDVGTGYHWLSLHRLGLAGAPAGISLCFHGQQLDMVTMGVDLPGAALENGWPTQAAIDAEVAFMKRTLGAALGRKLAGGHARFDWGEAWARFDPKGFMASSGLRYLPRS